MHASSADVRKLRCAVSLCFCLVLTLVLPVLYLLRQIQGCERVETLAGKMPEAQRLIDSIPSKSSICASSDKPRTHLGGAPLMSYNSGCTSDKLPVLHWRNDRSDEDQIKYHNGSLIVPQDGDYFVYVQVTFLCPDRICREIMYCGVNISAAIQVEQVVYKKSAVYSSRPIEQLRIGSIIRKKDNWKATVYVGGLLQLRRNDHVMVGVSDPLLVDTRKPERTFFGAFLI